MKLRILGKHSDLDSTEHSSGIGQNASEPVSPGIMKFLSRTVAFRAIRVHTGGTYCRALSTNAPRKQVSPKKKTTEPKKLSSSKSAAKGRFVSKPLQKLAARARAGSVSLRLVKLDAPAALISNVYILRLARATTQKLG